MSFFDTEDRITAFWLWPWAWSFGIDFDWHASEAQANVRLGPLVVVVWWTR